ncbi:response regulator [Striga asiatica]|uniref:Response regulator n=1 Tax=Striga asiatica TaxID=4170 RepID=A0A5A7Q1Z6_STRAF|nr:response regulator [Striga asiatica]
MRKTHATRFYDDKPDISNNGNNVKNKPLFLSILRGLVFLHQGLAFSVASVLSITPEKRSIISSLSGLCFHLLKPSKQHSFLFEKLPANWTEVGNAVAAYRLAQIRQGQDSPCSRVQIRIHFSYYSPRYAKVKYSIASAVNSICNEQVTSTTTTEGKATLLALRSIESPHARTLSDYEFLTFP